MATFVRVARVLIADAAGRPLPLSSAAFVGTPETLEVPAGPTIASTTLATDKGYAAEAWEISVATDDATEPVGIMWIEGEDGDDPTTGRLIPPGGGIHHYKCSGPDLVLNFQVAVMA